MEQWQLAGLITQRSRGSNPAPAIEVFEWNTEFFKEMQLLVLSRHRDEVIMIGDDIKITIVGIRGDKVRIGIDADKEVLIHRLEVFEAIKREAGAA